MNRNQKIALGCGGAGCLGLIVVAIAGGLIYYFMNRAAHNYNRNYNFNVSTNRNSNSNDNSDFTNRNDNASNSSNSSSSSSDSSMSDDDKHKLYQAASMTGEGELLRRVCVKLGLTNEDFTPAGDNYEKFVAEHVGWVMRNTNFIQSINSPEKARAYVNEHFPE
ncbi:MAG TPA: hypothetical protein VGN10_10915 [Pyrinomonadaceae bacterium]|jgi:hypothetical protein